MMEPVELTVRFWGKVLFGPGFWEWRQTAKKFGVSQSTISNILSGRTWTK